MAESNMSEQIRALKEQMKAYEDKMASEGKVISHDHSWKNEEKRGRGRPRKVVDPATANAPKRGRGRPRKVVDPSVAAMPKRGRGRPRKQVDPNAAMMPKRGRGRPRKVVDPAVAAMPKRGRGRPRKQPIAQMEAVETQQTIQAPQPQIYAQQPVYQVPQQAAPQPQYVPPQPVITPVIKSEPKQNIADNDSIVDDEEEINFDDILGQLDELAADTDDENNESETEQDAEPNEEQNAEPESMEDDGAPIAAAAVAASVPAAVALSSAEEEIQPTIEENEPIVGPADEQDVEEPVAAADDEEQEVQPTIEEDLPELEAVEEQAAEESNIAAEDEEQEMQPTLMEDEPMVSPVLEETKEDELSESESLQPTLSDENEGDALQPSITEENADTLDEETEIIPATKEPVEEADELPVEAKAEDDSNDIDPSFPTSWDEHSEMPYFEWYATRQKQWKSIGYKRLGGNEKVADEEVLKFIAKKAYKRRVILQESKIVAPVIVSLGGAVGGWFVGGDYMWYAVAGGFVGGGLLAYGITCLAGSGVTALLKTPEILRYKMSDLNARAKKVLDKYNALKDKHVGRANRIVKKKFAIFEEEAYDVYKKIKLVLNEIEKKSADNFYDADAKNHSAFIKKYRVSVAKIAKKYKFIKLNETLEDIKTVYNEILDDAQSFGSFLEATRLQGKIEATNYFENAKSGTLKKPKKVVERKNKETKQKEFMIPHLPEKEFNILKDRIPYYIEQCIDKHGKINTKKVFENADRVFGADINLKARFLTRAFNNETFVINDDNVFRVAKDVLLYPEYAELVGDDATANDFKTGVKKLADAINGSANATHLLTKFQEKLDPMFSEIFKKNFSVVMGVIGQLEEGKAEEEKIAKMEQEIREDRKQENDKLFAEWEAQYLKSLDPEDKKIYEDMDFAQKQELKKEVLKAIHEEMGDAEFYDDDEETPTITQDKKDDSDDDDSDNGLPKLPTLDAEGNFVEEAEAPLEIAGEDTVKETEESEIQPTLQSDEELMQPTLSEDMQPTLSDDIQPTLDANNSSMPLAGEGMQPSISDDMQPSVESIPETNDDTNDVQPSEGQDVPPSQLSNGLDSLDEMPSLPQVDENGNLIE